MARWVQMLFPTVRRKIALAVAVVSIIAGTSFAYFAHRTGYTILDRQLQNEAKTISDVTISVLNHAMLNKHDEHIRLTLQEVINGKPIAEAYFVREDGSISISPSSIDPMPPRLPVEQFKPSGSIDSQTFLLQHGDDGTYKYVLTKIEKSPECVRCHAGPSPTIGYLALKLDLSGSREISSDHRTMNILITILTFTGLGFIIFFSLSVLVIEPLGKLRTHLNTVKDKISSLESGDRVQFPKLPESNKNDEIADIVTSFNILLDRLNRANSTVFELHQKELAQADRLATTGEMAASLAHEIKNPIAGVLGALEVFDSEVADDDPKKEILTEMMVQLERVNQTVNDLLNYARPSPLFIENVLISELIERTLSLLIQQFKGKDFSIQLSLVDNEARIRADRKQFQQLLWNVLLNGAQSMQGVGTLAVSTTRIKSDLVVSITDTGKGIPLEEQDKIFKPFYTTKHKGTGLGLAISRRIIEQHHGSMVITSLVGKGTTVTLNVPLLNYEQ